MLNDVNDKFWAGVSASRHSSTSYWLRWPLLCTWLCVGLYLLSKTLKTTNIITDKKPKSKLLIEDLKKGYMPVDTSTLNNLCLKFSLQEQNLFNDKLFPAM